MAESEWNFSPSLGAAIALLVLFFATTVTHLYQAIRYKHRYCCIIIISGLLQLLTYMFRIMSITIPDSFSLYAAWFVLILIAPLWTNAFVYVLFGRMVMRYSYRNKVWCIKASHFGLVFVMLDVVAFIVQVYGAASAAAVRDAPPDAVLRGLHIYMGGVAIQLLFILIFCTFAIGLFRQIHSIKSFGSMDRRDCMVLLCAQSVALSMIIVRLSHYPEFRCCTSLKSTLPC